MNHFKLVTVETSVQNDSKTFTQSLFKNGWHADDFDIIGRGVKWKGWQTRCNIILEYLVNHPTVEYILLTDARDVIINATKEELYKYFIDANKDIIFGAESRGDSKITPGWTLAPYTFYQSNVGHVLTETLKLDKDTVRNRNNNGVIFGRRKAIASMIRHTSEYNDDQFGASEWIMDNADKFKIGLDTDNTLVYNFNRYHSNITEGDKIPMIYHFPGGRAECYNKTLHNLWPDDESMVKMTQKLSGASCLTDADKAIIITAAIVIFLFIVCIILAGLLLSKQNNKTQ
jgi:hypothetical protein